MGQGAVEARGRGFSTLFHHAFLLFFFSLFLFFFFKGDVKTPVRDLIRFMVRIRHLLTSLWSPPKRTARSRVREAQRIKWTYYCLSCVKWSDLPCPHLQIQNNLQHLHTLLPLYLAYKHIALPQGGRGATKAATRPCAVALAPAIIGLEKTYITIASFIYSTLSVAPVSS